MNARTVIGKTFAETWLTLIAMAVGLPIVAVVALVTFNLNREPLHTDPKAVASVMASAPLPRWAGAVERGQQIVRAGLTEQNLPGISVAVGVAGDIVWAEGFGWANLESRVPVTPAMRFRIGHVSKAFTSAGIGLLRQQGRLHLDDEIQGTCPRSPGNSGRSHCDS